MRAAPPRPPPSHVVVVGGGIVGASAAYHLTRLPNAPAVTLLEAAPTIAPAASGKAGGFLAADWAAGPMAAMAAAGFALHETLAEDLGGAAAVGYRRLDAYAASFTLGDEAAGHEVEPDRLLVFGEESVQRVHLGRPRVIFRASRPQ